MSHPHRSPHGLLAALALALALADAPADAQAGTGPAWNTPVPPRAPGATESADGDTGTQAGGDASAAAQETPGAAPDSETGGSEAVELEQVDGLPAGFPPQDRFADITRACLILSYELAPPEYRKAVWNFCQRRSHYSSRSQVVVSSVDGSQVHDRDRPVGWKFYREGLGRTIDPVTCEHHRLDESIDHPKVEREMAVAWPFRVPEMTDKKRASWMSHHHDAERFGTRGPHDNHLALAARYLPGCWAPEAMDRNDVAASITILRSVAICESYGGCKHSKVIRDHWRTGPKRSSKKRKGKTATASTK